MIVSKNKEIKKVSLVVPLYNEEQYIEGFIDSILVQEYDFNNIEVLFIDGNSKDKTVEIINERLKSSMINYKVLNNSKKITPISLNMGIRKAQNDIIIRLDAHSQYPSNYIERCVYYINHTDADNVGCPIKTESNGTIGNAIASVLSSKFGVGNSSFRTDKTSGYVDTVPFGTFYKALFEKIGYFDERLERNQDIEMNRRILKNGGKIYMFNDIQLTYHPRDTIEKLIKMAFMNGKWNLYTSYIVPGTLRLRHFIPFAFFLSLIVGMISIILKIGWIKVLFGIEIIAYSILNLLFSLKGGKQKPFGEKLLCLIIYPIFHVTYGIGTFFGIFFILKKRKKSNLENIKEEK